MVETTYFEDLEIGQIYIGDELVVDPDEMMAYNREYDPWPIHIDDEFASKTPFGSVISSGGYAISLWYKSYHTVFNTSQRRWSFLGGFDWHVKFPLPVRPNDKVHYRGKVLELIPSDTKPRGIVEMDNDLVNQDDDVVLNIRSKLLLAKRPT